jgi:hypothetical protein
MEMGIDEARKSDPASAVDFFDSRRRKIGTDGNQGTIAHVDVAARYVTQLRIHGYDIGVAHDELAAGRKLSRHTIRRP